MRGGRGGGGFRGGGGRIGGSRSGIGRIGGTGRAGGGLGGRGGMGGLGGVPRGGRGGMGGFGTGMLTGMLLGGGRRRRWGRGWGMGPGGGGGCGCGFFAVIAVIILLILLFVVFANPAGAVGGSEVTRSTIRREALPRGSAIDSGPLFTDYLGWIGNQQQLLSGLRNFHDRTGVRPHLYIVGEINGSTSVPTIAQLSAFANERYSALFNDEAHLLLVFFENVDGRYAMYAMPGNMARLVMDDEAGDILMDYIQRYYYTDMDEGEMFGRAFDDASRRIMTVTRSPWIPVLIVIGVIIVLLIIFAWWKKAKEQKNLEAEQTERILNQSLEEIGGSYDAASELAKQYEDDNTN